MRIAVASGKGGTGKTTVSLNLFHFFAQFVHPKIQLVDCDVEEPDTLLFFPELIHTATDEIYQYVPEIDTEHCTFCRRCTDWCTFNAITLVASQRYTAVNNDLCHSCGACLAACNYNAISEYPISIGQINEYTTPTGQTVMEGRLKIGSSMHTMLIKKLKQYAKSKNIPTIFDAPPGTSCPVVQTLTDNDYIIFVTEPTPFGIHDLKTAVEIAGKLQVPFGVIVNKSGLGTNDVFNFIEKEHITLLGTIPFSKEYARIYSEGKLLVNPDKAMEHIYLEILKKLLALL